MKLIRLVLLALLVSASAYAQTASLGMGAFSNESGPAIMAVDASLVNRTLKSPYVMFVVYLASKDQSQAITVAAKDVVMVYKGQEYRMPSVKELRKDYGAQIRDLDFYQRLGKEGINASWIRFYHFPERSNFFPPLTLNAPLAADEGHMAGQTGFLTAMYFKNPGLQKGDKLTIKVVDKKNAQLTGECDVVLD